MAPSLHQSNVYMQRKLRVWRAQKSIFVVGAKTVHTCAAKKHTCACLQTTSTYVKQYRAENENLLKSGSTFCHGTVFAPKQCLYQKEARGMESPKIYSSSRWKNRTYLCGLANYPKTTPKVDIKWKRRRCKAQKCITLVGAKVVC